MERERETLRKFTEWLDRYPVHFSTSYKFQLVQKGFARVGKVMAATGWPFAQKIRAIHYQTPFVKKLREVEMGKHLKERLGEVASRVIVSREGRLMIVTPQYANQQGMEPLYAGTEEQCTEAISCRVCEATMDEWAFSHGKGLCRFCLNDEATS